MRWRDGVLEFNGMVALSREKEKKHTASINGPVLLILRAAQNEIVVFHSMGFLLLLAVVKLKQTINSREKERGKIGRDRKG